MTPRQRADRLLVELGLFESRARAQAAIEAGLVTAEGRPVNKASDMIAADAALHATPAHPWVSRGGVKLASALDAFGIDPQGCVCLDVGKGQLHASLRERPEVVSLEATDIRALDAGRMREPIDLVVIDVSFISLKLVLPAALALTRQPAKLIALIKPQFEAGRPHLTKGIVRDAQVHRAVCDETASFVASLGLSVSGVLPSPLLGGDGNAEFLLRATRD